MSEYVDTTITFTGDSATLTDLFSKSQIGWLGDIADVFGVQVHCSGSIEDIDTEYHTIYQITRWETPLSIDLWNLVPGFLSIRISVIIFTLTSTSVTLKWEIRLIRYIMPLTKSNYF